MQDFTLTTYKKLLHELLANCYSFQTLQDFIQQPENKTVILRHDIDRKPENALVIGKIEKEVGIRASYYFRIVKESYDEDVIRQIVDMGHEIGYHYENLSEVSKKNPQINVDYLIGRRHTRTDADIYPADPSTISRSYGAGFAGQKESSLREKKEFRDKFFELAIDDFRLNLEKFRKLYPVKTICMHGSPLSKWDNRDLWKRYDYRDFGIIAEPYFDIDFNEVHYLTDTGRRWDGDRVSVRDKVLKKEDEKVIPVEQPEGSGSTGQESYPGEISCAVTSSISLGKEVRDLRFRSTWDIIAAAERGLLPDKIMINAHPQRWTNNPVEWTKELVWQNVKNVVKQIIIRRLR